MKNIFASLLVFVLSAQAWAGKINVAASIQTLASLAEEVGGDKVNVTSLSKGYMDPHFVEPKPSLVLVLNKADLLIHVGLELEIGWLPPLVLNSRNSKIQKGEDGNLVAAESIHILRVPSTKVDRSQGDIHPQGNPHFWIPPQNGLAIAKSISQRLSKIQPENATYFEKRLADFEKCINQMEKKLAPQISKIKNMNAVFYHDSWVYVTDWLKINEVGFIENKPGIAPDPQHLAKLISLVNERKKTTPVKYIVMENFYNRDIANSVSKKTGVPLLVLPSDVGATTEIKNYFDLVQTVAEKLAGD